MKLSVIGTGYVGLVTGSCLADTGNHVVGFDVDADKIAALRAGQCPFFEPGLAELVRANQDAGRLTFATDLPEAVRRAEVIFVAVGTPPQPNGAADVSALRASAEQIAPHVTQPTVLVVKSTVPVGTGDGIEELMKSQCAHPVAVVSNPEFLKEGTAVDDFQRPDRVVIGAQDTHAAALVKELHLPFVRNNRPILIMSRRAAELTKYAANAYLAMRISFINEIANVCDAHDIDVDQVRQGIGTDARIGFGFLYPGAGYGGSCFPKDVQALAHVAGEAKVEYDLFGVVHRINEHQKRLLFERIVRKFGPTLKGRRFAIWGVTFKPNTDDLRQAPALTTIDLLLSAGAEVVVHDPRGMDNLQRLFGQRVRCQKDAYAALDDCDALIIHTEWNEFRSPDFDEIRRRLKQPVIFDGRNLYAADTMKRAGFEYHSIGRPPVTASPG